VTCDDNLLHVGVLCTIGKVLNHLINDGIRRDCLLTGRILINVAIGPSAALPNKSLGCRAGGVGPWVACILVVAIRKVRSNNGNVGRSHSRISLSGRVQGSKHVGHVQLWVTLKAMNDNDSSLDLRWILLISIGVDHIVEKTCAGSIGVQDVPKSDIGARNAGHAVGEALPSILLSRGRLDKEE
jgi:hypothetical protein